MSRYKVYVTDTVENHIDEYEGDGVFFSITDKKSSNGKICCDYFDGIEMGAWLLSIQDQLDEFVEDHPDVKLALALAEILTDIIDKEEGEN